MTSDSEPSLSETTFFILLSLSPGARHGYAIMKDVAALSEDRVKLSTGTLYGALKRLLEQGWVHRVRDPLPNGMARERKAYALTDRGRRVLKSEIARLEKLVSIAQLRTVEEQA
jgi:DNA-binding PadR family transcriptional regulator